MTLFRVHSEGLDGSAASVLVEADSEGEAIVKRQNALQVAYDQGLTQFALDNNDYQAFMAVWDPGNPESVPDFDRYASGEWDLPQEPQRPLEPHKVIRAELAILEPDPNFGVIKE